MKKFKFTSRESNLNFASSSLFKKSFTLIELSIVLLILSLLVGSLLVGRQIVDRAKIQRIIFEFDYYEKAFHQFYDTYRVVPGNLSYKECIKHSEFSGCGCDRNVDYNCLIKREKACSNVYSNVNWCNKYAVAVAVDKKIIANLQRSKHNGMFHLKAAKLITEDNMPMNSDVNLGDGAQDFTFQFTNTADTRAGSTAAHEAKSTWNPNVSIFFRGLSKKDTIQNGYEVYRDVFEGHNMIVTFADKDAHTGWHTVDANSSTVNAKIAGELDAKIDDGRPGTGKFVSVKAGYSLIKTDEDTLKQVCFDQLTPNVKSAIYNSDTNLKYGCNIIKVMEDVK